jgi:hypothetical protein
VLKFTHPTKVQREVIKNIAYPIGQSQAFCEFKSRKILDDTSRQPCLIMQPWIEDGYILKALSRGDVLAFSP